MKLGLWLPVHHLTPPLESPWERTGTVSDVAAVVQDADESGFDFVCCAEHVALPVARQHQRGDRYWDPLASLGYISAITRRLAIVPFVVVLGYHHPLAIAKRYGTLDLLSGGRLIIGVGVGTLVEEFDLLGASFHDRGARADEALEALSHARGVRVPEYHGRFYDYEGMIVDPGLRTDTSFWVGGQSAASLRRATRFADAWAPVNTDADHVRSLLQSPAVRDHLETREKPLEIIVSNVRLDPLHQRDQTRRSLEALQAAGATGIVPRIPSSSVQHLIEQHRGLLAAARESAA
jgi:probable F420-dependent oxidoreductase